MDKKKFLTVSILVFMLGMGVITLVMTNSQHNLHKSFMLELINVKFKK